LKRIFIALIALIAGLGVARMVAAAQGQVQYPTPTTTTTGSRPATTSPPPPPPAPPDLANCQKQHPKMSIARASFDRFRRTTSVLAPITTLASGTAQVELLGGGRITQFTLPVDSARGRIRGTRGIDAAQARASTAILTLRYTGDADTRPQTLRVRAALHASKLSSSRPSIDETGTLTAAGAITKKARGVVRLTLEWVNSADGSIGVIERLAPIVNGRWGVRSELPPAIVSQINTRCSTLQSYVLFTGYQKLLMRGELRAFQVAPAPVQ
jgi:hypothetical protein